MQLMKQNEHYPKYSNDNLYIVERITQPDENSINNTHTTTLFTI